MVRRLRRSRDVHTDEVAIHQLTAVPRLNAEDGDRNAIDDERQADGSRARNLTAVSHSDVEPLYPAN